MLVIEGLVIIAIVAAVVLVVRPVIAERAKNRRIREARQAKLEAARSSEEVVQLLMLEPDLAGRVRDGLDRELKHPPQGG